MPRFRTYELLRKQKTLDLRRGAQLWLLTVRWFISLIDGEIYRSNDGLKDTTTV